MKRIRIIRYGSGSGSNNLKKICYEFGSRTYDNFHTNPDQDKIALIGTYSLTQRYGSKSCMDPRGGKIMKASSHIEKLSHNKPLQEYFKSQFNCFFAL